MGPTIQRIDMSTLSAEQAARRYVPRRWGSKPDNSDSLTLTQQREPYNSWGRYSVYMPYTTKMERLDNKATAHRTASNAPTSQDGRFDRFYSAKSCTPLSLQSASSPAFHQHCCQHQFDRLQQQHRAISRANSRVIVSRYSPPDLYRERLSETCWPQSQDRCSHFASTCPTGSYASPFTTDDDGGLGLFPVTTFSSTSKTRSRPRLRSFLILSHRNKPPFSKPDRYSANSVGGGRWTCFSTDTSNSVPLSSFEQFRPSRSSSITFSAQYSESYGVDEDSNTPPPSPYRAERDLRISGQRFHLSRVRSEAKYDYRRDHLSSTHRELHRSPREQDLYWVDVHTMDEKIADTLPTTPTSFGASTSYSDHNSAAQMEDGSQDSSRGAKVKKDWRFWMIFVALMLVAFCAGKLFLLRSG